MNSRENRSGIRRRAHGRQAERAVQRQRGLSLVELLLALALGIIVVTGIVQLFVGNSRTYNVINGQSRMQENARYALEFVSRAARDAGYLGCAPEFQNVVRGLRGNWTNVPEFDLTQMVQGFDAVGATWMPSLATLPRTESGSNFNVHTAGNGIDTSAIVPGTDVVVFRSVQNPGQRLAAVLQPLGNPVVVAPGGDPGIDLGDVVFVANCEQGAMFRVTGIVPNGDEATLQVATSGSGSFFLNSDTVEAPTGFVPFTLSFLGRSYGEESTLAAVESTFFFIAPSAGADNQGNVPSALWQKVGRARPVEVVQGVEDLQVLYGIDTTLSDGVSNANRYVTFNNVPNANQIVSIRVTVTVNSVDAVTDDGQRLRRTFSKTVSLRNSQPEA